MQQPSGGMMADVFISYSKKRSEPTKTLAGQLEAMGIDVWWDTGLKSGEAFDDAIRNELEAANAVIVIWTPESIESKYVKMEAGIAYAWEKLITVRTDDLRPESIPEPFRGLHADIVTDIDRILPALAKKHVSPKLSQEVILAALGQVDPSLPTAVGTFLQDCEKAGFSIVYNKSIMIKALIPHFGWITLAALFPDGKFQTNYIFNSAKNIGDTSIATKYLDRLVDLMGAAPVNHGNESWSWMNVFGERPSIAKIIPSGGDKWIALMRTARQDFEIAAARTIKRSA
jgi:hypothetical protein